MAFLFESIFVFGQMLLDYIVLHVCLHVRFLQSVFFVILS